MSTLRTLLKSKAWKGAAVESVPSHEFAAGSWDRGRRDVFPAYTAPAFKLTHPSGAVAYIKIGEEDDGPAGEKWRVGDPYPCAGKLCGDTSRNGHFHTYKPGRTIAEDKRNFDAYQKHLAKLGL